MNKLATTMRLSAGSRAAVGGGRRAVVSNAASSSLVSTLSKRGRQAGIPGAGRPLRVVLPDAPGNASASTAGLSRVSKGDLARCATINSGCGA